MKHSAVVCGVACSWGGLLMYW